MEQAAALVIGEHDFTSFAAVDPERGREDETVSNVRRIFVSHVGAGMGKNLFTQSGAADFCTTWCGIWWERSCWSGKNT